MEEASVGSFLRSLDDVTSPTEILSALVGKSIDLTSDSPGDTLKLDTLRTSSGPSRNRLKAVIRVFGRESELYSQGCPYVPSAFS